MRGLKARLHSDVGFEGAALLRLSKLVSKHPRTVGSHASCLLTLLPSKLGPCHRAALWPAVFVFPLCCFPGHIPACCFTQAMSCTAEDALEKLQLQGKIVLSATKSGEASVD